VRQFGTAEVVCKFGGTAGRQSESQSRKIGPVISETASVRLCSVESITRGAVETSYLYICMGHTTYMPLNRHCRIVLRIGSTGLHRRLSMCTLVYPKPKASTDPDCRRPTRPNESSGASSLTICLLRVLPGATGLAATTSLSRRSARCGGRPSAAPSGSGLSSVLGCVLCQLGGMWARARSSRGHDIAC